MFDFPASPVVDQEFNAGGIIYVWNGQGWTLKTNAGAEAYSKEESDAKFVKIPGDTMTGPLFITSATGAPHEIIRGDGPCLFLDRTTAANASFLVRATGYTDGR